MSQSRFIETEDGYLNLSEVRLLRRQRTKHGTSVLLAISKDGDTYECAGAAFKAERALWPVIPAQPGFFLLSVHPHGSIPDDLEKWINRDAIIAWRIGHWGPEPITVEDNMVPPHEIESTSEIYAVQSPDGHVAIQNGYTVDTPEEFIEFVRARWQGRAQARSDTEGAAA
jgi:hypothetical protein